MYWAGTILERAIGHWRFLLLYLVSGLAGSAGVMVKDSLSSGIPSLTLGASGALFGVLGALFILERRGHLTTGGQIAGLIVINLVFTFAFARLISIGGHIGGLFGGVMGMTLLLAFRGRPTLGAASLVARGAVFVVIAYSFRSSEPLEDHNHGARAPAA